MGESLHRGGNDERKEGHAEVHQEHHRDPRGAVPIAIHPTAQKYGILRSSLLAPVAGIMPRWKKLANLRSV
jgi:hypothetical protein